MNKIEIKERFDKIKKHLYDNRKEYLIGAGCLVAGMAIGVVTILVLKHYESIDNLIPGNSVTVKNVIAKNVTVVTSYLESRGHPGYIIRCIETGVIFPSQNYAADLMNLDASKISRHLNGMMDNVDGFHFERLAIAGHEVA